MVSKLIVVNDGKIVTLTVNGKVVWEGSLSDWSFAISHPGR